MQTIGIIGFGNMGSAIAEGIKKDYPVTVFDKDKSKTAKISGIGLAQNIVDTVKAADVIILAVKPQDFDTLSEIKNHINGQLIISIVAGIATGDIKKMLGKVRVIRVMPNLPARIGKGMICIYKDKSATKEDLDFCEKLFKKLGKTLILGKEEMINYATAVSGSGPGFFYDLIQGKTEEDIKKCVTPFITNLTASALSIGFSKPEASVLAEVTTKGSIAYLEQAHLSPEEAKKQVASKGGTTEAGLEVLHKGGSLSEAVKAALKRAQELSKS